MSSDHAESSVRVPTPAVQMNMQGLSMDEVAGRLHLARRQLAKGRITNLKFLLPLFLNLKGRPFTLDNHFPLEPLFSTNLPRELYVRSGRQIGKSSPPTSMVLMANGKFRPLGDIRIGDWVIALDSNNCRVQRRVVAVYHNGRKPIHKLTTRLGATFEGSEDHKIRTLSGYTPIKELKPGDRVAGVCLGGFFGEHTAPEARIVLTAYMIGDGHCTVASNLGITSMCPQVLAECRDYGQPLQVRPIRTVKSSGRASCVRFSSKSTFRDWLAEDHLIGKHSYNKSIPVWVFDLTREQTILFLSRLWATDGEVKLFGKLCNICYTSTSHVLAKQVKSLLAKFGIPASIRSKEPKCNGKVCRTAYTVRVETRPGLRKFLETFIVPGKPAFELPTTGENNNRDTVPREVGVLIKEAAAPIVRAGNKSLYAKGLRLSPKYPPSRRRMSEYIAALREEGCDTSKLEAANSSDIVWDEIVSIEPTIEQETMDLEIEIDHNYVCDFIYHSNSTALAAQGTIQSVCIKNFVTLFVTPLFEAIRRFSSNYVRPFVEDSPLASMWASSSATNSVLQREFNNKSMMIFSFAYLSADRTRGIPADKNAFDELQDLNPDFVPIIAETMSASPYGGILQGTGTPKTLDGLVDVCWSRSSKAEWVTRCPACNYENIAGLAYDLIKMIGPHNTEIGPGRPGTVCAKCSRPIDPRTGGWIHARPELRLDCAGYHIPQIIMPMHYGNEQRWKILTGKLEGMHNTPTHVFYNEVLGEGFDSGSKLVTITNLQQAATLHENTLQAAREVKDRYVRRIIGVDWGGGGAKRVSFTTIAVIGQLPTGQLECFYGERSITPNVPLQEAQLILKIAAALKCSHIAHDYTGAGSLREQFLFDAGVPHKSVIPIAYIGPTNGPLMRHVEATDYHPRHYYEVDKPRSLALICNQIRDGALKFFKYDHKGPDNPGLLHDFLSLIEEKNDSRAGGDLYTIIRNPKTNSPDDFVHAVNVACCSIWHMTQKWPDLAAVSKLEVSPELMATLNPARPSW